MLNVGKWCREIKQDVKMGRAGVGIAVVNTLVRDVSPEKLGSCTDLEAGWEAWRYEGRAVLPPRESSSAKALR